MKRAPWRIRFLYALPIALAVVASASAQTTLSAGAAADVGIDPVKLDAAVAEFRAAVERDEVRGAVLLVARRGKVVLHEALGWRDREADLKMEKDSLFRMASNTKPVVATAVMMLVEEGKLHLDAPVGAYLPSFNEGPSAGVTIRHLLTHTSGLRVGPIFYRPLIQASDEHPDAPSLQLEVARFGATGPEVTPGTSYSYSNAGYNTLGALIEVASQMPLADFLRERLYAPLGMKDSLNHESQAEHSRMSKVYRGGREGRDAAPAWTTSWKPGDAPDYPFVRASGGMISTAWDYATFCRMFLNGGIHGERRLLRADTVEIMTQPQTRALYSNEEIGRPSSFYGLGWQVSAGGVFSHGGSDGTQAWIDPERDLIVLALTQTPGARPDPRGRFRQAVVEACVD